MIWPDVPGCAPTSVCAMAHNSPWGCAILLAIGAFAGIVIYRALRRTQPAP